MECKRCQSHKVRKFVDGFGNTRIYCRECGYNVLENRFIKIEQTRLPQFEIHATPILSSVPSGASF